MALPTLIKTWQYNVNITDAVSTGGYGTTMFAWKQALTGFGSNPWTVVSSSKGDGTFGAVDHWVDVASCNIHGNGVNHSWIVLQQAALAGGAFQMCVDLKKTGGNQSSIMEVVISEGGLFTAGSATARPTATDEVLTSEGVGQSMWTGGQNLTVNPGRMHIQMSTDGKITRWWIYVAGAGHSFYSIEEPKNPVSGWTTPWICVAPVNRYAATAYTPSYIYLNDINVLTSVRYNGAKHNVFLTSEGFVSSMCGQTQTYANDLDGNSWPFFPIGIFCTTAAARGRHGALTDIWWGSVTRGDGDNYPADVSRQFVQVGDLIAPWNGTLMLIS